MNQIKIKDWCNNVSIFFELCAPDIYAQNDGTEHFDCLIMEKAQAMRLCINLSHKLWREIIPAITYLYNQTPRASNN